MNPTALRIIRHLNGLSLEQESTAVGIPKTALHRCETGLVVSDRTKRLISRRHPMYTYERLQTRVGPSDFHVPREAKS